MKDTVPPGRLCCAVRLDEILAKKIRRNNLIRLIATYFFHADLGNGSRTRVGFFVRISAHAASTALRIRQQGEDNEAKSTEQGRRNATRVRLPLPEIHFLYYLI